MSARPQVTITLGRSGQVVKKTGSISNMDNTDYKPSSGTKRSIRERLGRLGNVVDDSRSYGRPYQNKRQRAENDSWSVSDDDTEEDKQSMRSHQVGQNDLRFKLIEKRLLKRTMKSNDKRNVDLREKISRNTHGPLRFDRPQHEHESHGSDHFRQIPSARNAEDLCHMDTLKKPYSSNLDDGRRHRTPDRIIGTSRGMSPPRNYINDVRHVPLIRSVDMMRPTNLITKNSIMDGLRPDPSSARRTTAHAEAAKPVIRTPLTSSTMQKTPYMYQEPHSVVSLLHSLGLGKYVILFQAEEVDMAALKQMGDNDLKALGIPMGPRKKILLALLPRPKQRPL